MPPTNVLRSEAEDAGPSSPPYAFSPLPATGDMSHVDVFSTSKNVGPSAVNVYIASALTTSAVVSTLADVAGRA